MKAWLLVLTLIIPFSVFSMRKSSINPQIRSFIGKRVIGASKTNKANIFPGLKKFFSSGKKIRLYGTSQLKSSPFKRGRTKDLLGNKWTGVKKWIPWAMGASGIAGYLGYQYHNWVIPYEIIMNAIENDDSNSVIQLIKQNPKSFQRTYDFLFDSEKQEFLRYILLALDTQHAHNRDKLKYLLSALVRENIEGESIAKDLVTRKRIKNLKLLLNGEKAEIARERRRAAERREIARKKAQMDAELKATLYPERVGWFDWLQNFDGLAEKLGLINQKDPYSYVDSQISYVSNLLEEILKENRIELKKKHSKNNE